MHLRKMDTRRLHAPEIKQLVHVLRNDSTSCEDPKDSNAEKATVSAIKLLPRRLRSNLLSSHGSLCHTHKDLDHHLIDDIWAWIKFELESAIGRFIYPLIMCGTLSTEDEQQIRQLEPVIEMILPEWSLAASAPPGKRPIHTGTNWAYQENGCPACMLSRIGSDRRVLFALYSGMYGHLSLRNSNLKKSKRLRFIRYWMRTHPGGAEAAGDASAFGAKMKALRGDAKALLKQCGRPVRYVRDTISGPPLSAYHFPDNHTEIALEVLNPYSPKGSTTASATTSVSTFDLNKAEPYNPKDWTTATLHDPKLGPEPPPSPGTSTIASTKSRSSDKRTAFPPTPAATCNPARTTDALAPLPSPTTINRTASNRTSSSKRSLPKRHGPVISNTSPPFLRAPRPRSSVYSVASSIASYNASPDNNPPERSHAFDPLETPSERLDRYRKLLALSSQKANNESINNNSNNNDNDKDIDDEGRVVSLDYAETFNFRGFLLPKPSRSSLYAGFVGGEGGGEGIGGDRFEVCDLSPLPSPAGEGFGGGFGDMDDMLVPEGLVVAGNMGGLDLA